MWDNLTVLDDAGVVILNNGNGTLARNRLTVTGGWVNPPQNGQAYVVVSPEHGTHDCRCIDFQNGQATFNLV